MNKRTIVRLVGGALAAGLLLSTTACATRTQPDQVILYYKAGVGDNHVFQQCIEPGTSGPYAWDNETFALPTSLRTWNIRPSGGDTDQPIHSGSKPVVDDHGNTVQAGPEVVVYATADFFLNTNCGKNNNDPNSPVVQFWQNTGRRPWDGTHGISTNGDNGFDMKAWRVMLQNTLVPAEEAAVREQTRNYTADDLDGDLNGVWREMEDRIGPLFNDLLRQKVGGDYFCGTGYQRDKTVSWSEPVVGDDGKVTEVKKTGTCPPVRITITDINFADPAIAQARANVFKAKQDAEAALIAAQNQVDVANKLAQAGSNPQYLKLKELQTQVDIAQKQLEAAQACAKNPRCTVIVGAGGGVNVNAGQ